MSFPYKHVLLIGATSGIGLAMASRLVREGVKVTAVGRRKARLEQFVDSHGASNASAMQHDISDVSSAASFAADAMGRFPSIDCVFLNAGTQATHDWAQPAGVELAAFQAEMRVNFDAVVALTHAFLPLLQQQPRPTGVIFTSTHLALIPAAYLSGYSASKAALEAWILCLRYQLSSDPSNKVKVVELLPPLVQTELHDYLGEERGRAMGMPVDAFTEQAYQGLCSGEDEVSVGGVGIEKVTSILHEVRAKRNEAFAVFSDALAARQKSS